MNGINLDTCDYCGGTEEVAKGEANRCEKCHDLHAAEAEAAMKGATKGCHIEGEDTGVFHEDCGPWRSYHLSAYGETFEEAMKDATIFEIDQDGGDLNDYPLEDASGELQAAGERMIKKEFGLI